MINIEIAQGYLQAGLAVLPADKVRKCPVLPGWKRYQEELPTESEVHAWFSNHHHALCIVLRFPLPNDYQPVSRLAFFVP